MFLIRDVFQAKPGQAKALVEKFKQTIPIMKKEGMKSPRLMTDFIGTYWTVVMENEIDDLTVYTSQMRTFTSKKEVADIMKGYMDLVQGGHREVFILE